MMRRGMTFEEELKALAGREGERNRLLCSIAAKGRLAGYSHDEVIAMISDNYGKKDSATGKDIARAVDKIWDNPQLAPRTPYKRPFARFGAPKPLAALKTTPARETDADVLSGYVREMIAAGGGEASSADLIALSPKPIGTTPAAQAAAFCRALDAPDAGYFFVGEARQKRTRDRLVKLAAFATQLEAGTVREWPHLIMPNDVTGEPMKNERGEDSYALEACLLHKRFAIVEFDDMPIRVQAAFWRGIIRNGNWPLQSLVFSGKKSIHGLLRLDDSRHTFTEDWQVIEEHFASDPDKNYKCDLACKNPGRMTRFPGALRTDPTAGKTHCQCLLYLA